MVFSPNDAPLIHHLGSPPADVVAVASGVYESIADRPDSIYTPHQSSSQKSCQTLDTDEKSPYYRSADAGRPDPFRPVYPRRHLYDSCGFNQIHFPEAIFMYIPQAPAARAVLQVGHNQLQLLSFSCWPPLTHA